MDGSVFIIGAGAAGGSLAVSLVRRGVALAGVCDSREERALEIAAAADSCPAFGDPPAGMGGARVVVVAAPDDSINVVARDVVAKGLTRRTQVWLHLSGALSPGVLGPLEGNVADIGSFHPAHVFAPGRVTRLPPGVSYAVDGGAEAVEVGKALASALGGHAVEVRGGAERTRYHAATVLASNYLVALLAEARVLLAEDGMADEEADRLLSSLALSAVERVRDIGIDASLSGPVRRGDKGTVAAHISVLQRSPNTLEIYKVVGRAAARLATRIGETDPALTTAIDTLLKG